MADLIWGNLEKSLDDPTTIEQAINNAIEAHNNDPEAHLGAGQSLENHKTADVIDHPAGSITTDKSTLGLCDYNLFFSDYSGWSKSSVGTGFSYTPELGQVYFEMSDDNVKGNLFSEVLSFQNYVRLKNSFTISTQISLDGGQNTNDFIYWGIDVYDYAISPAFGFVIKDEKIFVAYRQFSSPATPVLIDLNLSATFDGLPRIFRIDYDNQSDTMIWSYNGGFVHSIANASSVCSFNFDSDIGYSFNMKNADYLGVTLLAPRATVDFRII